MLRHSVVAESAGQSPVEDTEVVHVREEDKKATKMMADNTASE